VTLQSTFLRTMGFSRDTTRYLSHDSDDDLGSGTTLAEPETGTEHRGSIIMGLGVKDLRLTRQHDIILWRRTCSANEIRPPKTIGELLTPRSTERTLNYPY
jgi:hypothetical protein